MSEDKPKKKAKKKKGHPVRLSDFAFAYVSENKEGSLRETIDAMIVRYGELVELIESMKTRFVLPSSIYSTLKEARGAAVLLSVKSKKKQIEEPVEVKVSE